MPSRVRGQNSPRAQLPRRPSTRCATLPCGARALDVFAPGDGVHGRRRRRPRPAARPPPARARPRRRGRPRRRSPRALGGDVAAHERFGTATRAASATAASTSPARARERYLRPGALPEVEPAHAGGGPPPPRRDRQRDGARPRRRAARGARRGGGPRRRASCASSTTAPSPTTRRGCGASPATPRGSGSRSSPDTARAGRTRPTRRRSAATASGPSCASPCASPTRRPRCAPPATSAAAAARGFDPDPPGLADALALLPPEGRRDLVTLAAATAGMDARALAGLARRDGLHRPRPRHGRRRARARRPARRCARRARRAEIARAARGAPLEAVALAGGENARRWIDELRHVRLEITGDDLSPPACRRARRSASACAGRWTASSTGRSRARRPSCAPRSSATRLAAQR